MVKTCNKCHRRIEGENVYWRRNRHRTRITACRSCRNEYQRARKLRIKSSGTATLNSQGEDVMATSSGGGKNAPWNLYKVKPEARDTWQRFQIELDGTRTPCFDAAEAYTGYDDPRYPDEADPENPKPAPTALEASLLCADCPLASLCGAFAALEKPDFGVWGGVAWSGGKPGVSPR